MLLLVLDMMGTFSIEQYFLVASHFNCVVYWLHSFTFSQNAYKYERSAINVELNEWQFFAMEWGDDIFIDFSRYQYYLYTYQTVTVSYSQVVWVANVSDFLREKLETMLIIVQMDTQRILLSLKFEYGRWVKD